MLDNYDQSMLNAGYYAQKNANVYNSCSSVAIVNMVSKYKKTIYANNAFNNFVYQAQQNKYSTQLGQIPNNKMKAGLSLCASQNSVKKEGAEFTFNKRARTRSSVKEGTPVLIAFSKYCHSVVVKGVETFTLSYKNPKTNKTITKDIEFFIVNEGWGYHEGSLVLSELFSDSTGDAFILK